MIASAPSQASAASAARILGTMPPAMTPASMSVSASADGQRVEPAAVGVADAVDVGQQDELAGAEPGRDARGRVVGVDVADDPVLVAGERRDDRHLAADEDRVEEVAAEADDVGDEPERRRRAPRSSRPPSTPDRPTASTPRSRRPATSSLLTTPRRTAAATSSAAWSVTRRPSSKLRRDAEPVEPLGDPLAAAVDEDDGPATRDRGDLVEDLRPGPRSSSRRA